MKKSRLTGLLIALCLAATSAIAAAQQEPQQPESPPAARPEAAQPAKDIPAAVDPKTFKLGPEDVIEVDVWREPQISRQHVIRPDGKFTMPMINEVQAAGLTPEELSRVITKELSEFINDPQVWVHVRAVRSQKYYVTGEVNRPGAYPLAVPTTVFEAISLAGGFREFANRKRITIVRGDERIRFNYKDIVRGRNLNQNIRLQNGDHVIIP